MRKILTILCLSCIGVMATPIKEKHTDKVAAMNAAQSWAKQNGLEVRNIGHTNSMLGIIKPGSIVTLELRHPNQKYLVGEVVIFKDYRGTNTSTIHQVIAVRPDAVYTKGSFNRIGDGWIKLERIIGKVDKNFIW